MYLKLFLISALVVVTAVVQDDPPEDPPGRVFTIAEGSKWAGPFYRRAAFWWGPTRQDDASMVFIFERPEEAVRFTIKLFGLSMARLSLAPAHHDSDRFVATYLDDGVRIAPYAYRDGEIYRGDTFRAFVPYGDAVELHLNVTEIGTTYTVAVGDSTESSFIAREPAAYRRLKLKNFAHARGGTYREAPVEVQFRAFFPGE